MITKGQAKIMDFGLAKLAGQTKVILKMLLEMEKAGVTIINRRNLENSFNKS